MKFACEHCHTKYTIEDERVRGKLLKIRCKGCQNLITVRDPASVVAPMAAPPSASTASGVNDWYVSFDGQQEGPFSLDQARSRVRDEARSGKEAHAWRPSYSAWKPVAEVSELAPALAAPPAVPPVAAPAVAAPTPSPPIRPLTPVPPVAMPGASLASRAAAAASKPLTAAPTSAAPTPASQPVTASVPTPPSVAPAPTAIPAPPVLSTPAASTTPPPVAAPVAATISPSAPTDGAQNGAAHAGNGAMKHAPLDPFAELLSTGDATSGATEDAANQPQIVIVERPVGRGLVYALGACMVIIVLLGGALGYTWLSWIPAQRQLLAAQQANPPTETNDPAQRRYEDHPVGMIDTAPNPQAPTAPIDVAQLGGAQQAAKAATRTTKGHDAHPTRGATEAQPTQLSNSQSELAKMYGDSELSGSAALPQVNDQQKSKQQVSDAQITSVISRNKKSIQVCYDRVLKHDDSVRNLRVDVELKIGSSGMVTGVTIADARIASSELGTCLVQTIKRWHFPEQDQGYQTAFPLLLQAQN